MTRQLQSLIVATLALGTQAAASHEYLTATAIVTNAQNHSAFECWRFTTPLSISEQAGTSGAATFKFSNLTGATYTVIPPRYNGGTHNAPAPQLVAFLSGLIHLTLPYPVSNNSTDNEAWVVGGANGLIMAVDTQGSGHISTYPSDMATISFQIPIVEGSSPPYRVLNSGPCHFADSPGQLSAGGNGTLSA